MTRLRTPLLFFYFAFTTCALGGDKSDSVDIKKVMEKVYPALVRIFVVSTAYERGREVKRTSSGSGTIISAEGLVVTNHHVAGHATRIWCTLADKEMVEAKLIGTDAMTDIAVIKLLPETMRHPVKSFAHAAWGDSSSLAVGDKVFAMGSPGALAQSVTYGIVANPSVVLPGRGMQLDGESVGTLVRWVFHDAQIYHGNSGGPLVNTRGEIIGVNEIGVAALGGAIPSNTAKLIAEELTRNGQVLRSWTGISVQRLLHRQKNDQGILINGTTPGSPAEKAGLKPGDLIIAIDDTPIQARFAEQMPDFYRLVLQAPANKHLNLLIRRDKEEKKISLGTLERGRVLSKEEEVKSWGITGMNMTRLLRLTLRIDSTAGVFLTSINPGGAAGLARPTLAKGDIILTVGGVAIENLEHLAEVNRTITENKEEGVPTVVGFWRNGEHMMTSVKIGPEEDPQAVPETRKAWFPAKVQVLTKSLAKTMMIPKTKGVRITRIFDQLKSAGFVLGDILTHIDGMKIDASEPGHEQRFPTMIRRYSPESEAVFTVLRAGKKIKVTCKLPAEPKPIRELKKYKDDILEFTVRELSVMDLIDRRLPEDQTGAFVSTVKNGSWTSLAGLRAGDIILEVNGGTVITVADIENLIAAIRKEKPESIVMFIKRAADTRFVEIRPDWKQK